MDNHLKDLQRISNSSKRPSTSLLFVITSWVISMTLGTSAILLINYPHHLSIMLSLSFAATIAHSIVVTIRYAHLEPISREIVYLNNEINRLRERDENV